MTEDKEERKLRALEQYARGVAGIGELGGSKIREIETRLDSLEEKVSALLHDITIDEIRIKELKEEVFSDE